ncbi:hypothetical protein EJ04DRAFT_449022 [Polyplosphaeria fusca]|uniref:Rhodopsin domain-containing protein n=1 Tax=Polyplosphaeria fusca TaxID=682080 RepID=A0A9P4UXX4_9PLEO|nr:hypothetical protein EJ04DRAFT_449022 [Polyplosphaeria fusca]
MNDVNELIARAEDLFPRAGGLYPPGSVLQNWPRPNYVDPDTHGWAGPIVCIVFLAFAFVVYILRMWARLILAKNPGMDDLLMSLAMIPLIGSTVAVVLGITIYGFHLHAWDQTATTFITTRQITLAIEVLYLVATSLIKISILCFYRRLTSGVISRKFIYCVWISIAFVVAYAFVFIFVIIFSCTPIEGYWHLFDVSWRLTHDLHCHNEAAEIVAVVVISTLQDFFLVCLPIFLVWNLRVPRRQKAALIGIFALGLFTCVCGILRMVYAIYVYYYTYDITWYAAYGWIWTAVEADLGVICASAPALKVFFRRYFNLSGSRSGRSGSSGAFNAKRSARSDPESSTGGSRTGIPISIPLDRIAVRRGTEVVVEERDENGSRHSHDSTRELTALPPFPPSHRTELFSPPFVERCRTICAASRPESRIVPVDPRLLRETSRKVLPS